MGSDGSLVFWIIGIGVVLMFASALGSSRLGLVPAPPVWMPVVVSIAVLASALWVILQKDYSVDAQKWAFGAVGLIVGFWLKQPGNQT